MDYTLDYSNKNQTYINNPNVNWDCYFACYGLNQMIEKLQVLSIGYTVIKFSGLTITAFPFTTIANSLSPTIEKEVSL